MKILQYLILLFLFTIQSISHAQYRQQLEYPKEKLNISIQGATNDINFNPIYGAIGFEYDYLRKNKWELSLGIHYVHEFMKFWENRNTMPRDPNMDYFEEHRFSREENSHNVQIPLTACMYYSRKLKLYLKGGYGIEYALHDDIKLWYASTKKVYYGAENEIYVKEVAPIYNASLDVSTIRRPIQETTGLKNKIIHEIYFSPIGLKLKKSRFELFGKIRTSWNHLGLKYSYYFL